MDIFELLSFDFKEFATSTGGILIILGILCLIIGIAFFFKKDKEKAGDSSKTEEPAKTEPVATPTTTEATSQAPAETPTASTAAPVVVPSEGDGVKEVPVAQVAETINFNEPAQASTEPIAVETPVVAPVADLKPEALEMPTVAPTTEAPAVVQPTTPAVYGGVSPEVLKPEVEPEKPREIYGGANPLENTAPIPTTAVNQAYAGNSPEPATIAPVVVPTPVVEPTTVAPVVVPTPVVEPTTVAPVVVPTPVVEPTTVAPVAAPTPVAPAAPAEKKEEIEKLEF